MSTILNLINKYKNVIYVVLIVILFPLITLMTEIVFNSGKILGTIIRTLMENGIC